MIRTRAFPLVVRLGLTFLLISSVAMTVLAGGLVLAVRSYEINRRQTELNAQADLYAALAEELIAPNGNLQAATPILVTRSAGEGNLAIRVFGTAGQVFGASSRTSPFPSRAVVALLPSSVLSVVIGEDAQRRYVARTIEWDGRVVGVIEVSQSLNEEQRLFGLLRRAIGQTTVVAALSAMIGAALVARWLARLIGNLRRTTESMAAGDLTTRAVERGPHEFVSLTHAINTMAQQLAERLERLEAQSEIQRRFYRDVSHELRTPLMALGGYLENIEDASTKDDQTQSMAAMHGEIARLGRLADELLRGDSTPQLELGPLHPVDIAALADGIVENLHNRATRSGVTLVRQGSTEPILVPADRDRLKQAILNVIDNGLRATPPGGTIIVHVLGVADAVWIDIVDDGAGIAPALREAIWERGVRGAEGGSGLGLAIVRSIMQAHGGNASVVPTTSGAHIRLTLPRS